MVKQTADSRFTLRWFLQAGLGMLLIVLLAVHLIVNHWAAPHGLLTYADVIRYYDLSGIVWMEGVFLIVVTIHCLLGIHAIILDLNLNPVITRTLARALILAGTVAILYGLWLIEIIHSLSVS
jgi:succinate dehydrogenase/fumarate reductase cytochrome b subunit